MAETTGISWTHHTFNPWSGCVRISPACANCYAANLPPGMRRGAVWAKDAERVVGSDAYWNQPIAWNRAALRADERRRVFCASTADVFEDRADLDVHRLRLWKLIAATPWLDWLLLTKRPAKMAEWAEQHGWPINAWAGVTVEDQARADERIPLLLRVPAAVRFLSCEPLLGPVSLREIPFEGGVIHALTGAHAYADTGRLPPGEPKIHWVIAGGESGHKARPSNAEWFRDLRDACIAARVPYHFKQWGEWRQFSAGDFGGEGSTEAQQAWRDYEAALWGSSIPARGWPNNGSISHRIGKKDAGRLLDGQEWLEFPAGGAACS